jgi:CRP-like cAMP-binding protein
MYIQTNIEAASAIQWPGAYTTSENTGRNFAPHDPVFFEGDDAEHFYEVLEGVVVACKVFLDGRRQVISFGFPGDLIGFGHGETYRFDCKTLGPARLRTIPRNSLLSAIRQRPELGEKLLDAASTEVANMRDHSILLGRKTATERVASFLLNLAERSGAICNGTIVPLPMSRADMGDFLGLTIETVSRNMTKLRNHEVISLNTRGGFTILDFEELRFLAEDEGCAH